MYVRLNSHKLLCSGAVPHDPAPEGVLHGHWRRGSPGQDEPAERPKVSLTARKLEGYGVILSFLFAELSRSKCFRVFASLRIRREGILLTPTTLPTAISLPSRLWQRNIRTGSFSCRKEPSWACVCVCVGQVPVGQGGGAEREEGQGPGGGPAQGGQVRLQLHHTRHTFHDQAGGNHRQRTAALPYVTACIQL